MDDNGYILIVDDEPKICQFLEVLLRREGHKATSVHNATEALERIRTEDFTLVVTDLKMPGMDGFEFVQQLKSMSPELPVIMITGYATVETAVKALRCGVDDYITKPFNIDELRKVIARTMGTRRVAKENRQLTELLQQVKNQLAQHQAALAETSLQSAPPGASAVAETRQDKVAENDLNRLLKQVLGMINENLGARASSIMLRAGDALEFRACEGDRIRDLIGTRQPLGKGVAGYVAREQLPLLVKDEKTRAVLPPSQASIYDSASFICVPILHNDQTLGVINVGEKNDKAPFTEDDLQFVKSVANQIAPVMCHATALFAVKAQCRQTLEALAATYETKSPYHYEHGQRVADLAVSLAKACDASAEEIEAVRHAAQLYDIGKICVKDHLFQKEGLLTEEEHEILRQIPVIGEKMLGHMDFMRPLMPIIRHHRERMDGHGYPDGLRGDKIPFLARVLAIADAYEAMTSERPYRRALSRDEALTEIERESGLQFDEEMAKIFMDRVLGSLS